MKTDFNPRLEGLKDLGIYLGLALCCAGLGAIGFLIAQDLARVSIP
jgi:hypothetical protein